MQEVQGVLVALYCSASMVPISAARKAAWVRSETSSLAMICWTWFFTVLTLRS